MGRVLHLGPNVYKFSAVKQSFSTLPRQVQRSEHKTFVHLYNVGDVGPTLYICYTNVLCSLGEAADSKENQLIISAEHLQIARK